MQLLDDHVWKNGQLCAYFPLRTLGDNKDDLLLETLDTRLNVGLWKISD